MDRPDLAERSDLSIRPPPNLRLLLLLLLFVATGDVGVDDEGRRIADEPPLPDRVVDDGGIIATAAPPPPPPPAPLVRVALAPRRALEAGVGKGDFADPPSSALDSFVVLLLDVDDRPVSLFIIFFCRLFVVFLYFVNMIIYLQHTHTVV